MTARKRTAKPPKRASVQRHAMAFTLTALARELGVSRDRLALLLQRTNAEPISNGAGHVLYRVRDAHRALAAGSSLEAMSPFERRAHHEAQLAEMRARQRAGELCEVDDVRDVCLRFGKHVVHKLEILPDLVERDMGAPPHIVDYIERTVDAFRTELARDIREGVFLRIEPEAPAPQSRADEVAA